MAPYDKVPHAGGKIHNWYLKKLNSFGDLNIKVATFCKPDEIGKIDLDEYGIDYEVYVRPRGGILNELKRTVAFASKALVFNRFAGLVPSDYQRGIKYLVKRIGASSFSPDVVIMQWTEIVFFLPMFKQLWPGARYVAIEEDVSYLGQMRRAEYCTDPFMRSFFRCKSRRVKELEIGYLNSVDCAVFNNDKDLRLAIGDGFDNRSLVWTPFYQRPRNEQQYSVGNRIIFYGAMNREENWKSAIWFIRSVMPLIGDLDVIFEIVGANPNRKLYEYESEKVIIKGFVPDIEEELKSSVCLVAPLVLGAGVKIKIIEAMAVGIPVLTNVIGIEGIPAVAGRDYLFCEKPEEYAKAISLLLYDSSMRNRIGEAASQMVRDRFDYEKDSGVFHELIKSI